MADTVLKDIFVFSFIAISWDECKILNHSVYIHLLFPYVITVQTFQKNMLFFFYSQRCAASKALLTIWSV